MTISSLVVSNAGPLITLAKIRRSQLLKDLFGHVMIPRAVFEEVVLRGAGEPGAEETRSAGWIETRFAVDDLSVAVLREGLGAGEAKSLSWRKKWALTCSCSTTRLPAARPSVWD